MWYRDRKDWGFPEGTEERGAQREDWENYSIFPEIDPAFGRNNFYWSDVDSWSDQPLFLLFFVLMLINQNSITLSLIYLYVLMINV